MPDVTDDDEGDEEWKLPDEEVNKMYGPYAQEEDFSKITAKQDELLYGPDISGDWKKIKDWDDLVPRATKKKIIEIDLFSISGNLRCPALYLQPGSIYFCFCQQKASESRNRGNVFTEKPSPRSAQYQGMVGSGTIETLCTELKKFTTCERFKLWKKQMG